MSGKPADLNPQQWVILFGIIDRVFKNNPEPMTLSEIIRAVQSHQKFRDSNIGAALVFMLKKGRLSRTQHGDVFKFNIVRH